MESKTASRHNRSRRDRQVRAALVDLRAALNALDGQDVPAAILYGSHARGEANDASDVDVLLVYGALSSAGRRSGT